MSDSLLTHQVEFAISMLGFYVLAQLVLSWLQVRPGGVGHFVVFLASIAFGFVAPHAFPDPLAFGVGLFCLAGSILGLRELLGKRHEGLSSWEVGAPVIFLFLMLLFGGLQIVSGFFGGLGPHDRRVDRQATDLRRLGEALETYRSDYAREWPPTLSVLAGEGYAEPFTERDWKGQDVVYEQPAANCRGGRVVAYSWPPYRGASAVLYADGHVCTARVREPGLLTDPDTGDVIHSSLVAHRRER